MIILTLKEWIMKNKPRSFKYKQIKIKYKCKQCGKEKTIRPSNLKSKNINRLFCTLGCSTTYRNLHDGVPAQKKGWREKWIKSCVKNKTLPIKEKNPRWIKDRKIVIFVRKNESKYTQRIEYALNGYKSEKGKIKFYEDHGYHVESLRRHIERQFKKNMTWKNYGAWEVDHIKPTSYYLYNKIIDFKIINALNNLRPLWKSENRKKNKF